MKSTLEGWRLETSTSRYSTCLDPSSATASVRPLAFSASAIVGLSARVWDVSSQPTNALKPQRRTARIERSTRQLVGPHSSYDDKTGIKSVVLLIGAP